MSREYDTSTEPLWCEDCKHFGHTDMGGEGYCDKVKGETWYGQPICHSFTPKGPENEQIYEIAKILNRANGRNENSTYFLQDATDIYNAGYRKQSEGEWGFDGLSWTCSECGEYATKGIKTTYCPHCGAKMKGGAE